jgi:signal transduction histidine kinase
MIRTRLALWNSAVLAVVLTLLGFAAFFSTRASVYGAVDQDLRRRSDFIRENWDNIPETPPNPPPKLVPIMGTEPAQFRLVEFEALTARPCIVRVGYSNSGFRAQPWDAFALRRSLNGSKELFDTILDGHRARILSLPILVGGKISGAVQFAASLEHADAGVARLGRALLVLLPIALPFTSITGVWLTRHALRPVAAITDEASRIGARNLEERLTVSGDDEFGHLAGVFNSMLDRLEGSFRGVEAAYESQRRFTADASHELKTPLTAIKMRLGVAKQSVQTPERYIEHMSSIERSADAMSAIVADLLLLASTDEDKLTICGRLLPVDSLVDEAASIVEEIHRRPIERTVELDLQIRGDDGISRVIVNLLDNAVRHTPPDGTVSLTAERAGGLVRIRVKDTGVGIPTSDLPHVFDRFYRVGPARDRDSGGTGLGLAIVRSIVKAHGGDVVVESSVGHGTTVIVDLPAA